jgi:hypothetical protein
VVSSAVPIVGSGAFNDIGSSQRQSWYQVQLVSWYQVHRSLKPLPYEGSGRGGAVAASYPQRLVVMDANSPVVMGAVASWEQVQTIVVLEALGFHNTLIIKRKCEIF